MKITDAEIEETVKFVATGITEDGKANASPELDELAQSLLSSVALKQKAHLCLLEIAMGGPGKSVATLLSHLEVSMMIGYLIGRAQERNKDASPTP